MRLRVHDIVLRRLLVLRLLEGVKRGLDRCHGGSRGGGSRLMHLARVHELLRVLNGVVAEISRKSTASGGVGGGFKQWMWSYEHGNGIEMPYC